MLIKSTVVLLLFEIYLIKDLYRDLGVRRTAVLKGCTSGVIQNIPTPPEPVMEFKIISGDIYTLSVP